MTPVNGIYKIPGLVPGRLTLPFFTPQLKTFSAAGTSLNAKARKKLWKMLDRFCEVTIESENSKDPVDWIEISRQYYTEFSDIVTKEGAALDDAVFEGVSEDFHQFVLSKTEESLYMLLTIIGDMNKVLKAIGAEEATEEETLQPNPEDGSYLLAKIRQDEDDDIQEEPVVEKTERVLH